MFKTSAVLLIMMSATASAADPSADEILQHLKMRREQTENLYIKAEWKEFAHGVPGAVEIQEIFRDNLGRVRVKYSQNSPGTAATRPREYDDLYDGEVTIETRIDPNLDRYGHPAVSESGSPFVEATVHDGIFPQGGGPDSHRNPFTFLDESVIRALSGLVAHQKPVHVKRIEDGSNRFELRYQLDRALDPEMMQHVVVVDGDKDWTIASHAQYFPDGKRARETTCTYQFDDDFWRPVRGSWKHWWKSKSKVPELEWQFTVSICKRNNPEFDEKVFASPVQRGAYVSDTRAGIGFFLNDQSALTNELAALAQKAKSDANAPAGSSNPFPENPDSKRMLSHFLLGVNILVAVFVLIVLIRGRRFPN